jgi:thiamine-monophosphate kinase
MRQKPGSTTQKSRGELALIDRIRSRAGRISNNSLSLGVGDDCALLRLKTGEEAAVTTDLSIEGRHFRLDLHPAEAIGHRTLARGLSDIAAMGARPVAAFLSLGLPPELTRSAGSRSSAWIDRFLDGFLALATQHKTPLAGGDLAQSSITLADIVLIGAVPAGKALRRSGARPGDILYVTGSLGGSALGLRRLSQRSSRRQQQGLAPHLCPQPRIPQGLWIRRRNAASAAIDVSDGLSTDLHHLCKESRVSAEIDAASLPVFPGANLNDALHGGEDYELLFTAHPSVRIPRRIGGVPVTRIGIVLKNRAADRVLLIDSAGKRQPLEPGGWEHFRTAKPE